MKTHSIWPHYSARFLGWLLGSLALSGCQADSTGDRMASYSHTWSGVKLELLGAKLAPGVSADCLDNATALLRARIRENRLAPLKVLVFADHPLVKDSMSPPALRLTLLDSQSGSYWLGLHPDRPKTLIRQQISSNQYNAFEPPSYLEVQEIRACLVFEFS